MIFHWKRVKNGYADGYVSKVDFASALLHTGCRGCYEKSPEGGGKSSSAKTEAEEIVHWSTLFIVFLEEDIY